MAEKKSWRDYSKNYSGDKSTNNSGEEEKTGSWRDYSQSLSNAKTTKASWRDYATNDPGSIVGGNVTNRVNKWLTNHNSYLSGYQKRYSGRKYSYEDSYVSDSASWLDTVSKQADELEAERQNILSYIDQYKGYLDEDWVRKVRDTLTSARDTHSKIIESATKDNEWWNGFGDEELVSKYGSAEDAYKYYQRSDGYQKKYNGMTSEELYGLVGKMEDGEEKEWLSSYASTVDYDEKSKLDFDQAEKEIEDLGNLYDEAYTIGLWYDEYQRGYAPYDAHKLEVYNRLMNEYGGDPDALKGEITAKQARLNQSKYIQKGNKLAGVGDAESEHYDPEFNQYSNYVNDGKTPLIPDYKDIAYDIINGNQDAKNGISMATAWGRLSDSESSRLDAVEHMTPEEKSIYNYYYNKHGYDAAEEYLSTIMEGLNAKKAAEMFAPMKDKTALELVFGIAAGFDQFNSGIVNLFNTDDYIPASAIQQTSAAVRDDLKDAGFKLPKWMGGASIGQGAYDLVTTTANMVPSIMVSTAVGMLNPTAGAATGAALMGASAGGNAYQEALNLGYDKGQARAYSTLVGASEAGLQYLMGGIGKLGSNLSGKAATTLASKFNNAYARLAVKYGANMLSEGAEEYLQEILTPMFKNLALGTDEDIELITEDAIYSFILGSLSSGVMEVTGISSDNGKGLIGNLKDISSKNEANVKAATMYGDVQQELIAEGLASPTNSESYQLAEMFKRKTDKGKSMTGFEIRQLVGANEAQFVVENYDEALPLAKKRLVELGETKDVDKIAKLVAKRASGQELTAAEKSTLVKSQYGAKVAKEMTPTASDLSYKSLEERAGTEARFGVSESGEATIRETGEAIDLSKVAVSKVGDGQVTFKLEDSREVYAGDIDFADDNQSYMVSAVSDIENITPAAATAMIRDIVDTAKPIGAQLNGIDEAYTYGYHGYSEADLKAGNFTGDLTSEQMMSAYKLGQSARATSKTNKVQAFKRMRTAVQAATEKAIAEGKAAPKAKGMSITYNYGNGKVVSIEEADIKTAKQEGGVAVAKILQDMGIGTNVEFFSSYITKDEHGNKIRVFKDDNGVEQKAYSGVYRKSDGTIRIDLNAYNGRGLTLNALSHELTHFIQQWSPEKYEVLTDFLMKTYEKTDMSMHDRVLREQARLERVRGEEVSYNEAYDEVVANAMGKMFDDGKLLEKLKELASVDKSLVEKILEGIKEFFNKFVAVYEKQSALYHDTADIMAMKDTVEKLQSILAEALVDASGNYQTYLTASENQLLTEAGIGFDENTKSVYSLHFSTAFQDEIQVGKKTFDTEAIAQAVAKGTGRSIEDARKWVQSELTIANIVMANPEFLDFEADNRYEAIKKNSDYPQGTVDLSNLCPKREEFTAMFDRLQKKYPNKLFTAQDVAEMRKILAENDITVACGACFVEDRRQLLGEIADTYINMWKEAVESGKPLQKTNAAGVKSDLLVTKALAKQYGLTAGSKIMATDTYIPTQYDLTTYEGFKLLEKNHPTIAMGFNRYNNSRGQQSARLIEGRAEYNRQILGWSDAKVRSVNNNGGLRIFSFSDFEVVHLLDLVQVIIDCAAKGVKIQGYTKIPAFAKLVRGTGIKLNRSLIPKGDYGYHMENGKVVLDYDTTEGIDINDDNFIDDRSDPDIGNIVIGINPTQIGAAMLDPFVDYIIPFHSNKAKEILKKLGTGEWVNYKESQHEKDISTGKASKHNVNIYTEVINKYHPTNKVDFVNAFLKECKRQGKIPRYSEFLNVNANGDYTYREGYHKLLVDFKMFDAEGNILPQGNITPSLDDGFMADLLNAEIKKKQDYEFPQKVYDAIDKKFGEQYSSQETDLDSEGNQLSAEQQEFFKDSVVRDADGKLMVMYHGTANGGAFTVFDGDQLDNSSLKSQIGQGFYFTNVKKEAESYMQNVDIYGRVSKGKNPNLHQVYLNITNPFDINADKLDLEKVKAVYMDGSKDHFFDSFISHYLNNKTVNGRVFTKAEVQAMSKADRVSLYVDYLAQIGTKELLSNMVQAFSYGKQSALLTSMQNRLGYDGIVDEYAPGKFQYVAFSSEQVKYTDNHNPTSSPDIRYSSQETDLDTETDSAYDSAKKETKQEVKANGRREETREDFHRRAVQEGCTVNDRGEVAYAFRSVADWNLAESIRIAERNLREKGIPVIVCDLFEVNRDGITTPRTNAIAAAGEAVYLLTSMEADPIEAAEHEAYHFWKHTQARMDYFAELYKNFDFDSPAAIDLLGRIEKAYIESPKANVETDVEVESDESVKLIEEAFAFVTGFAASGDQRGIAHKILRDFDAVKAAWDDLIKKQTTQKGQQYSSQETDADNAPTFYSQMGKVVEGMKQEKFGASSVISMLRGRGVKAEEIRWSGIQAFLEGKKSVTKQELLDFINSSMLHIEETMLDGSKGEPVKLPNNYRLEETENGMGDPILNLYIDDELVDTFEQIFDGSISSTGDSDIWAMNEEDLTGQILSHYAGMSYDEAYGNGSKETKWDKYTLDGGDNYRELLFKMPGSAYNNQAMEAHWGDHGFGVLAHARIQDFDTFIGKMLFIEEIQSDWHNAGQKIGYNVSPEIAIEKLNAEIDKLSQQLDEIVWPADDADDVEYLAKYEVAMAENHRIGDKIVELRNRRRDLLVNGQITPDAPFKDNYYEYVLKRLLRMAAEEGYDSIGWTTSDIQSNRWSDKYAEGYRIEYDQDIPKFLKKYGKQWGTTVGKTTLDNGTEVWSMAITDSMQKSVLTEGQAMYSEHDTDYSNRSLLASAFEGITKSSVEYEMIQEYKNRIRILNEQEEKLDKLNAEIREIRFGTDGKYDAKKLKELEAEAKNVAKNINRHDKKLLSLEASEPLRKVIDRERKKEAQKTKDHVKEIQQNRKVRAEQSELRHKIRKAIRDLDKILNRGNKKQNVKEDMQNVVTKALQAADILFTDNYGTYDMLRNGLGVDLSDSEEALVKTCTQMLKDLDKMPADGYENWQARQEAENKLRTKMSKLNEVFARERKRLNNTTVSSILGELADAYKSLETSDQSYVQGAYSEPVYNFLKNLQNEVGGTIVKDMSKDQLENVYAAYKMVLTTVRKANQMFNEELKLSREQLGNAVIEEVFKAGGVHLLGTKMGDAISQFDWNNMKPIWLANRIGSETFGKLMNGLFKGQYNFAVDIDGAKKFKLEMDEKYGPRNWDAEKLYEFESSTGKKFSLNLQQIMSLYAFSKREQAYSHLISGGFVFEDNSTVVVDGKLGIKKTYIHKGATSYKLNVATLNGIINSLTAEQKAYVDDMQKYLSDVMGAKGNEVSMQLYGIKMFNEQFYFPLRSSGAYMERAKEAEMKKQQGQINLVNSGFTHSVKPEAKNPIILSGFMDVWAEHCNEMSMYHSMVLPMEDFRKVYNYSTIHDEKMESASVYQTIQDAYGKAATNYIDQLYRELNAGATVDPRETPWKKLISNFKKAAVMLSGSVVVQQFSSIGRAYAVIDPKYFIGTKVNSDTNLSVVEEMKKYAPVAIIKEMGGFDTGTKGSAKSYIMAEQYGKGERIQGLLKDEQYRGDIMGMLPAKADELTWCAIWEAAKRETKAKNPKMDVKSEEFLKLAGDRFSEVIEKTQVYDSVMARSANMRSKGNFMAMATAFMAEPTTTVNLLEDAIRSGKANTIARAFGSVAVSIVLNNALASIIYAMRDDDEDETFLEKYFQSFTSGMIDDINPMSYYPFLKDVYSLFQGYDVERADMSVIADVRDALKKVVTLLGKDTSEMDDDELAEHYKQVNEVFMGLLDAGCSAFGVPVKNVRRDAMGIINAWKTVSTDLSGERDNSWFSFWDKVGSAAKDTIPVYAWTKDKAKVDKLYDAIMSGDKAYLARLKSTYKDDSAYQSAVRKALRENDSRIHDAALARYEGRTEEYKRIFREIQKEGKFTFDDIMSAINSEESKIRSGLEPEKATSKYTASDFVESIVLDDTTSAQAIKEDIIATKVANGKTQEEAEKEFTSNVSTAIRDAYSSGLLDEAGAEKMLMEYAGKDEEEAASKVSYWAFCEEHPGYDLSESNVKDYKEFAEPAEIDLDVFVQYINGTKGLTEIKDEWGDVEVTKREQVLEVIDSLPLTWEQKDALYLAAGYSESKIWDVPW